MRISLFWKIVIAVIILYFLWDPLTNASAGFFNLVDTTLQVSNTASPILMWSLLGALTGGCCGALISYQKFRLQKKALLIPCIVSVVILTLFALTARNNNVRNKLQKKLKDEISMSELGISTKPEV